jgi:hypothetical protein
LVSQEELKTELQSYIDNNLVEENRPTSSASEAAAKFTEVGYIVPWDFSSTDDAPSYCVPSASWFSARR